MRGVKVFANATDRDAAYGGTGEPTLEEGEVCYLMDANTILAYTGSEWVAAADASSDQFVLASQIFN
jgi:hypothetical protein